MPLPRNLPQSAKSQEAPLKQPAAPRILARRYRVGEKLGSGAFGTVFVVTDLKTHSERKVLKQIGVGDLLPDETVHAVKEARLLAKLDHPSIVKFHDSFLEKDFFCIVTELCEGGDLDQKVRQWKKTGRSFDETLIVDWFIQLTTAIMYIHERRILHRDIKTRNIFLKRNLIKLGDFGISRILMGTTDLASTFTGTPHTMSPETLKQNGYNTKSDIWSLGVVLYELCTLQRAFPGTNLMAVMYSIVEGERPELPAKFTFDLRNIYDRMLEKNPRKRPSAAVILQDSFLRRRLERLHDKLAVQPTPAEAVSHSPSSSPSPSSPVRAKLEAEAIAKALTPVKKQNLQPSTTDGLPLTPRQKLFLRKREKADREAEKRRRLTARNFSEGRKRFSAQRKKQTKVVPPWVAEHPDVFSDPDFSLTQLSRGDSLTGGELSEMPEQQVAEVGMEVRERERERGEMGREVEEGDRREVGREREVEVEVRERERVEVREIKREEEAMDESEGEGEDGEEEGIPDDPSLAESHYSQFDDFEDDSSSEDEYEALMECIEGALDLPNHSIPESPPGSPSNHDDFCPFSNQAREKKIELLKSQCMAIYGEELYHRIYSYLWEARSHSVPHGDEANVVSGLKLLTDNTRDCFLVDQIVFLQRQT